MDSASIDLSAARNVAITAVGAAGEILLDCYRRRSTDVRIKADTSLQTSADLAAEQVLIEYVRSAFPNHAIASEEQGWRVDAEKDASSLWRIDPLDGTENFVFDAHALLPRSVAARSGLRASNRYALHSDAWSGSLEEWRTSSRIEHDAVQPVPCVFSSRF